MSGRTMEEMLSGSKPVSVSVHLGAFATSASCLQSVLKSHKDRLEKHGVCYLGPDQLRGERGLVFPGGRGNRTPASCADLNTAALTAHVEEHLSRYPLTHLILSDGALLGSVRRLTVDGSLYADAPNFLSALPRWLDSEATTVCLSIRHLGALLSEEVSRVAMRRQIPDIARIESALWADLGSWHTVVAWIRSHFRKSKVMIWRHEDFTKVADTVVTELTKGVLERLDGADTAPSLSARALAYMSDHADSSGKLDMPSLRLRYAMKHFPVSAKYPAFSIGDAALRSHIDAGYKSDWAEISGMWPEAVLQPR